MRLQRVRTLASRPAVRRGGDAIYGIALMRVMRRVCRDELSFSIVGVTRPGSPPHTLLLAGGQGRQYRSCSPALTHILLLLPVANLVAAKKRTRKSEHADVDSADVFDTSDVGKTTPAFVVRT